MCCWRRIFSISMRARFNAFASTFGFAASPPSSRVSKTRVVLVQAMGRPKLIPSSLHPTRPPRCTPRAHFSQQIHANRRHRIAQKLSVVYAVVVVAAWPSTRVVVVVHASRRDHRAIDDVGRFCAVVALRRSPAKRKRKGSPRRRERAKVSTERKTKTKKIHPRDGETSAASRTHRRPPGTEQLLQQRQQTAESFGGRVLLVLLK